MICKKCANEYDDSLEVCPVCQTENKKKNFKVTIDAGKLDGASEAVYDDAVKKPGRKEIRQEKAKEKGKEKLRSMGKKEKGATRFIVSAVCVMAVLMASLSCLSIFTDVFSKDDTVKTMALSSLSPVDAGELEAYLSKLYVLTGFELDDDTASDEFYVNIMPENEN